MSQPLTAESPRRRAAREFAIALRRHMDRKGLGRHRLARAAGCGSSAIANFLAGSNLPRLATARALSEALGTDELLQIILASRTYSCEVCNATFVYDGMGPRRYCGQSCLAVAAKRRVGTPRRVVAVRFERSLRLHQEAILAFCRACESDGLCKDATCQLRAVSPLPMATKQLLAPRPT